jgi:hypothetical protein
MKRIFEKYIPITLILGITIFGLGYCTYQKSLRDFSPAEGNIIEGQIITFQYKSSGKSGGATYIKVKLNSGIIVDVIDYPTGVVPKTYRGTIALIHEQESMLAKPRYTIAVNETRRLLSKN